MPPTRSIPLWDRLVLGHGVVEATARSCDADVLHIKGPAADSRLRTPGRASSDVDVLVRPSDAPGLVEQLRSGGCRIRSDFGSGSPFEHAATVFHPQWGWIDVHRRFPGIGLEPGEAFDVLWGQRSKVMVAGTAVNVPCTMHQALLLALNAARDIERREADVMQLRDALTTSEWGQLEACTARFHAEVAFAAAIGRLDDFAKDPAHDLWLVMSVGGGRWDEWRARWRAARSVRERAGVVHTLLRVNLSQVEAGLGRPPGRSDLWRAQRTRVSVAVNELRQRPTRRDE